MTRFRGGEIGTSFGLSNAKGWQVVPLGEAAFSATRVQREIEDGERVEIKISPDHSYFMMLYLQDALHCDVDAIGNEVEARHYQRGSICLISLGDGATISLKSSIDAIAFVLPKLLFKELVEKYPEHRFDELKVMRGVSDDVMRNLGAALLPFFDFDGPAAPLESIAVAICAHLIDAYAVVSSSSGAAPRLSLSEWQEQLAKRFMLENFAEDISVDAVADHAGLPSGRFEEFFKAATGLSPVDWLRRIRVEQAKAMMLAHTRPLSELPRACGFYSEQEFSQAFVAEEGVTPARWLSQSLN